MKKFFNGLLPAMILLSFGIIPHPVNAASPSVTYEGGAEKFVFDTDAEDFGNAFSSMLPGEARTLDFTLKNTDTRTMSFYFSASALKDLQNVREAAYQISFSRDDEVFFEGRLGGEGGTLTELGENTDLSGGLLLTRLKPGAACQISMSLLIDGTSAGNDYQDSTGILRFTFRAAFDEPATTTVTETIPGKIIKETITTFTAAKTGDGTDLRTPLFLLAAGLALFAIYLLLRRKRRDPS